MAAGDDVFTLTVFPMYPGNPGNSGDLIGVAEAPLTADGVLRFGEVIVDAARRVAAGKVDDIDGGRPDALDISLIGPFATQRTAPSAEPVHPITLLQNAASDHELTVLEEIAERAGLIWTCPVAPWTNLRGEPCGECGRTEEEARTHAGADGSAGADEAVTIHLSGHQPDTGTATLTPLLVPEVSQTVFVVRPDARAAAYFGARHMAGEVVGGIVPTSGGWAVTAYRDRADLFRPGAATYDLPKARSRRQAVRFLLRWWHWVARAVDEGADAAALDPGDLAAGERRALFR